jgi:chromosome segregation ATPase
MNYDEDTWDPGVSGYISSAAAVKLYEDSSSDEDEDKEVTDDEPSECDFRMAIMTLKTLRRGQKKTVERFSAQLRTLEQAHQRERARGDTLFRQHEVDKEKIAALEGKIRAHGTFNSETTEKVEKLERDLAEAEKSMEQERMAHSHASEQLKERNATLKESHDELKRALERWTGYANSLMENLDSTEELRIAAKNVVNFDAHAEGPSLWGLLDNLQKAVRKLESSDKVKR